MAERAALPNAPEVQKSTRKTYTINEKFHVTARWLSMWYSKYKAHQKCTNDNCSRIEVHLIVKHISLLSAGFIRDISVCA